MSTSGNGGLNPHLGGGLPANHLRLEALALFVTAGPAPSFTVVRVGKSDAQCILLLVSSLFDSLQEAREVTSR